MAMIDIEYRHTDKAIDDVTIRRTTAGKMSSYIQDLVYEMKSGDISCSYKEKWWRQVWDTELRIV